MSNQEHKEWTTGSATQIDTYESCERKWWFGSVAKYIRDETLSLQLGTDTHLLIECALRGEPVPGGVPILEDAHRLAALALAPSGWLMSTLAGRTLSTEQIEIEFEDSETFSKPVRGKIDVMLIDVDHVNKCVGVHIIDHKTTKSRNYILGKKRLLKNIQGLLYANHAYHSVLRQYPDYAVNVEFTLHYMIKEEGQPVVVSSVNYSEADLANGRAKINDLLEKMQEDSRKQNYFDVLTRPAACGRYGGCPFKARCNTPVLLTEQVIDEGEIMSFWNEFDAKNKNKPSERPEQTSVQRPVVFIDCLPFNQEVVPLESWLSDEIRAYEKKTGLPYVASPYNEGAKTIIGAATAANKLLPDMLHVSSASPLGQLAIATLKTSNALLVFGTR